MFRNATKNRPNYLTSNHLNKLKEHTYSAKGKSIIEPGFQKFWNWIINFVPLGIAPNTLTIVGLFANVVSAILVGFYSPLAATELPAWSLLICAAGLFVYQTLDALDGKQARRTSTSSQLGELFDHGCDAISTNFVVLGNIIAVGMGKYPWLAFIHYFVTIGLFYLAHWQVYVTGTLEFGLLDVTESQLAVIMVYIVSAIFGVEFWTTKIPIIDMEWKIFHFLVMLGGGLIIFMRYTRLILRGGSGRHGATVANTSILFPFCPIALVISMAITVAVKSPTQIYHQHPVLFLITFGMVTCKVTQKLVVAHMTRSELSLLDYELIGPLLLILNQYLFNSFLDEFFVLCFCCLITVINLLIYDRSICNEIADFLNINIFSVLPRPQVRNNNEDICNSKFNASPTLTALSSKARLRSSNQNKSTMSYAVSRDSHNRKHVLS